MGKPTFDLCYSETILRTCGIVSVRAERPRGGFGLAEITMKVFNSEFIGVKSEPGELKHLSTRRKGHQRDSVSSGERTRTRPVLLFDEPERLGKVGLSG